LRRDIGKSEEPLGPECGMTGTLHLIIAEKLGRTESGVVESLLQIGAKHDAGRLSEVRHEAYSLTVPELDQSSMPLAVIDPSRGEHEPEVDL
jgi:hypothetical protein